MRPECRPRGTPPGARGLAKRSPTVQPHNSKRKAAGRTRRLLEPALNRSERSASANHPNYSSSAVLQRLQAALWSHRAALIVAVAAMHPAVLASLAAMTAEFGEHDEALLLAIVQTLVERAGGVCEFLEHGAALGHHVGAQVE